MCSASLSPRFEALRVRAAALALEEGTARKARLRRLATTFDAHRERLAAALAADLGRHPLESELIELHPTGAELRHALRRVKGWMRPRRVGTPLSLMGTRSWIHPEPKGVVLIMAPWNYPIFLLLGPLVAALAAGNAVMVKPSEKAPATERALAELLREAFPDGEVDVAHGGPEMAEALLELPWNHVFFTGSTRIGQRVMAAAARHLTPVTLELGGKSPAVVTASADLDQAATRLAWGKLVNAGQTCVAPDYLLVHADVLPAFLERLKARLEAQAGAAPLDNPDYASLVDDAAFARQQALLDGAVAAGATVVCGGARDAVRRRLAPTVLTGVPLEHPLMKEEIFGPLLPVLPYRSEPEALAVIRTLDEPLSLYVFAGTRAEERAWIRRTRAGGTGLGQTVVHLANPNLPFGGRGPSGLGAYHGEHGFWTFSHARAVLRQGLLEPLALYRPPYGGAFKRLAFRMLRWLE
ncbi:MAG TPA: aldehyde dehydrogenase family protein [Holophagaceae bacterium]|nr:aldehyde dehydrogenase family protein [Holophagaceae bacterium]